MFWPGPFGRDVEEQNGIAETFLQPKFGGDLRAFTGSEAV